MSRVRTQIPAKEISPCEMEIVTAIHSMAITLGEFPLIGAITNSIHGHQSKNNTFDLNSFTSKGQEGKIGQDKVDL